MQTTKNPQGATNQPLLLTVDQIAKLLQVSTRTIWRMRNANQIPREVRVGSGIRWRTFDIVQWIEDGCPEQPAREMDVGEISE